MTDCDCLEGCPFFNDRMANMPVMAEMYKKNYCKSNFEDCARHMVKNALGNSLVPEDLFPSQQEKAREVIKK